MSISSLDPPVAKLIADLSAHVQSRFGIKVPDRCDGEFLSESDPGVYRWFLMRRWHEHLKPEDRPGPLALFVLGYVPMLPFDLLQLLVRCACLPVVWFLWRVERYLGQWLGVHYFCALCHHVTREPYVYCPQCRRVQGRLRPTLSGLFWRTCDCGKHRWPTLGNFLVRRPRPLVCRHTRRTFGCYRPDPLDKLERPVAPRHVALAGPSVRTKHAVLSHLILQTLRDSPQKQGAYRLPWRVNQLEAEICRQHLYQSLTRDTQPCEQIGPHHTLARTFVLQGSGRKLLVLHHVAQAWLSSEANLLTAGPNWTHTDSLIYVIDPEFAEGELQRGGLTHAAVFERLVRTIQQQAMLQPDVPLPLRVAVVVPLSPSARGRYHPGVSLDVRSEEAENIVQQVSPSLYALLKRCLPSRNLRFYGGLMPDALRLDETRWLRDLLPWTTGKAALK